MKLNEILFFENDEEFQQRIDPEAPPRPVDKQSLPSTEVELTNKPILSAPHVRPPNPAKERLKKAVIGIVAKYQEHALSYTVALHELMEQGLEAYVAKKILKYGIHYVRKLFGKN